MRSVLSEGFCATRPFRFVRLREAGGDATHTTVRISRIRQSHGVLVLHVCYGQHVLRLHATSQHVMLGMAVSSSCRRYCRLEVHNAQYSLPVSVCMHLFFPSFPKVGCTTLRSVSTVSQNTGSSHAKDVRCVSGIVYIRHIWPCPESALLPGGPHQQQQHLQDAESGRKTAYKRAPCTSYNCCNCRLVRVE